MPYQNRQRARDDYSSQSLPTKWVVVFCHNGFEYTIIVPVSQNKSFAFTKLLFLRLQSKLRLICP